MSHNITEQLGLLSSAVSEPLNALWQSLFLHYSDWEVYVYGSFMVTTLAFWLPSLFFLALDLPISPHFLRRYKMQPGQNEPLTLPDLIRALKRVVFNTWVLNPLLGLISAPVYLWASGPLNRPLPSLGEFFLHLVVFMLVEEVGFYYSHRLFHQPYFYKRIHKIHHEWTAPVALTAVYAHPLEHLLSNSIPVMAGPLLMGSHPVSMWIWYTMALLSTTYSHSGYHFPFTPTSEFHDYHHLKFSNNFGALGFLDWFHGTDAHFKTSPQFKNHQTYFSLTPIWETTNTAKEIRAFFKAKVTSRPEDSQKSE